jgi:hypothetical protein
MTAEWDWDCQIARSNFLGFFTGKSFFWLHQQIFFVSRWRGSTPRQCLDIQKESEGAVLFHTKQKLNVD